MTILPPRFVVRNQPIYPVDVISRFWKKVVIGTDDECWLWSSGKNKSGYGRFKIGRSDRLAHRTSWEIYHNVRLGQLQALHHCDTPACCNPHHLFTGTDQDNSDDKVRKGRQSRAGLKGKSNPRAKLRSNDIDQIRMMIAMGVPNTQIGMYMDITHQMVWRIRHGLAWDHH